MIGTIIFFENCPKDRKVHKIFKIFRYYIFVKHDLKWIEITSQLRKLRSLFVKFKDQNGGFCRWLSWSKNGSLGNGFWWNRTTNKFRKKLPLFSPKKKHFLSLLKLRLNRVYFKKLCHLKSMNFNWNDKLINSLGITRERQSRLRTSSHSASSKKNYCSQCTIPYYRPRSLIRNELHRTNFEYDFCEYSLKLQKGFQRRDLSAPLYPPAKMFAALQWT